MSTNPSKKRILCVDDDSSICEFVSFLLKDCEVISAHTKGDAIRQALVQGFDLILLDYQLTDGDGLETCLLIRQFDRDVPILFITTHALITDSQVLKIGAQGLIKKGLDMANNLASTVEHLLSKSA